MTTCRATRTHFRRRCLSAPQSRRTASTRSVCCSDGRGRRRSSRPLRFAMSRATGLTSLTMTRDDRLLDALRHLPRPTIVYTTQVDDARKLQEGLAGLGRGSSLQVVTGRAQRRIGVRRSTACAIGRSIWSSPRPRSGSASTNRMFAPSFTRACRRRSTGGIRRSGAAVATAAPPSLSLVTSATSRSRRLVPAKDHQHRTRSRPLGGDAQAGRSRSRTAECGCLWNAIPADLDERLQAQSSVESPHAIAPASR